MIGVGLAGGWIVSKGHWIEGYKLINLYKYIHTIKLSDVKF